MQLWPSYGVTRKNGKDKGGAISRNNLIYIGHWRDLAFAKDFKQILRRIYAEMRCWTEKVGRTKVISVFCIAVFNPKPTQLLFKVFGETMSYLFTSYHNTDAIHYLSSLNVHKEKKKYNQY